MELIYTILCVCVCVRVRACVCILCECMRLFLLCDVPVSYNVVSQVLRDIYLLHSDPDIISLLVFVHYVCVCMYVCIYVCMYVRSSDVYHRTFSYEAPYIHDMY